MIVKSRPRYTDFGELPPQFSATKSDYRQGWWPSDIEGELTKSYMSEQYRNLTREEAPFGTGSQEFRSTERSRPLYNDVVNRKTFSFNYPFASAYEWTYRRQLWLSILRGYTRANYHTPLGNMLTLQEDFDLQHARSRAWWTMQPRFEGEVSMLNFLFELKDFKDIIKFISKDNGRVWSTFCKKAKQISQQFQPHHRKKVRDAGGDKLPITQISDTFNDVASLWLLKSLMLDPLIMDLTSIVAQAAVSARELQNEFKRDGSVVQKTHYSEMLYENRVIDYTYAESSSTFWAEHYRQSTAKFTATMQYTYDYKMRSAKEAFIKYWGLNGSVSAFWNAIPFSFLVDYVVGIGNAIHAMEIDPNVDLRVVQYCDSVLSQTYHAYGYRKSSRTHAFIYTPGEAMYDEAEGLYPLSGALESLYVRTRREPVKGFYLPLLKTMSDKQWKNASALAKLLVFS